MADAAHAQGNFPVSLFRRRWDRRGALIFMAVLCLHGLVVWRAGSFPRSRTPGFEHWPPLLVVAVQRVKPDTPDASEPMKRTPPAARQTTPRNKRTPTGAPLWLRFQWPGRHHPYPYPHPRRPNLLPACRSRPPPHLFSLSNRPPCAAPRATQPTRPMHPAR